MCTRFSNITRPSREINAQISQDHHCADEIFIRKLLFVKTCSSTSASVCCFVVISKSCIFASITCRSFQHAMINYDDILINTQRYSNTENTCENREFQCENIQKDASFRPQLVFFFPSWCIHWHPLKMQLIQKYILSSQKKFHAHFIVFQNPFLHGFISLKLNCKSILMGSECGSITSNPIIR